MKSQFVIGLSVLCAGSLILNAYQWQRYHHLTQQKSADLVQNSFSERTSARKKELLQKRTRSWAKEKSHSITKQENDIPVEAQTNSIAAVNESRGDNPFRELFRTPEMKEFMKARQKGMLADTYKDFVGLAVLTPQEREKFLDILVENQMPFWGDRMNRESQASTNQITSEQMNDELQQLLGPSRYAQYESYRKTIGQRIALNQFEQQMALSEVPLQSYQKEQLLQILTEENRDNPFNGMRQREMMQALSQSDEAVAGQYFENRRKATERALVRAQTVLNPKQLEQFKEFQNGLLKIHEAGFKAFRERANQPN